MLAAAGLAILPFGAAAVPLRPGWVAMPTALRYPVLLDALRRAVQAAGLDVQSDTGPTGEAADRGVLIPGNRVLGVFSNELAVRLLRASLAATIEVPLRFLVTENPDGTATLAWKSAALVFAPYLDEGGHDLATLVAELDARLAAIAAQAVR